MKSDKTNAFVITLAFFAVLFVLGMTAKGCTQRMGDSYFGRMTQYDVNGR